MFISSVSFFFNMTPRDGIDYIRVTMIAVRKPSTPDRSNTRAPNIRIDLRRPPFSP